MNDRKNTAEKVVPIRNTREQKRTKKDELKDDVNSSSENNSKFYLKWARFVVDGVSDYSNEKLIEKASLELRELVMNERKATYIKELTHKQSQKESANENIKFLSKEQDRDREKLSKMEPSQIESSGEVKKLDFPTHLKVLCWILPFLSIFVIMASITTMVEIIKLDLSFFDDSIASWTMAIILSFSPISLKLYDENLSESNHIKLFNSLIILSLIGLIATVICIAFLGVETSGEDLLNSMETIGSTTDDSSKWFGIIRTISLVICESSANGAIWIFLFRTWGKYGKSKSGKKVSHSPDYLWLKKVINDRENEMEKLKKIICEADSFEKRVNHELSKLLLEASVYLNQLIEERRKEI